MEILFENSFLEIAPSASSIFAPREVPLRIICFERTNSLFSIDGNLYSFTILIANANANANANAFSQTILFFAICHSSLLKVHCINPEF
jgi:hypothetical protein